MKTALRFTILLDLIFCVTAGALASGEGAATLYNQGNALYAKGDYAGALKSYKHALDQKVADPNLEQNIGSAYLKLGDIGQAVFHFERGLMLNPRNQDLRYNLEFAKSLRKDEVPDKSAPLLARLYRNILGAVTTGEAVMVTVVFYFALCLGLLLVIFIQGRLRPVLIVISAVLIFLIIISLPVSFGKVYQDHFKARGVVVAAETTARSGPGTEMPDAFVVHGGMPCEIHENRAGWARISIPSGLTGWVAARDVEALTF